MALVCLYFQVHQPFRLRPYTVFEIGKEHHYENADMNCDILLRVAQKCYLPMNDLLLQLIRKHKNKFRVSFAVSGVALEQFEQYAPEIIDSFRALAETGCVEFLAESHSHSLAFLYSRAEFEQQVRRHSQRIEELFGQKPKSFRNTELVYNNEVAEAAENMGYAAVLAEGADHVLGWRSPNFVYQPATCSKVKLLLRNYSLSDDIAFRFSDQSWSEYPLTAEKYVTWLEKESNKTELLNLFMDYETFGEHHKEHTGIFEFMRSLPEKVLAGKKLSFACVSEAASRLEAHARLDVPQFMSWADAERDLTAWTGNDMQRDALESLYRLEDRVKAGANPDLLQVWRRLQSSDHFYYMCTKWFADGDVHKYFNPYGNPYDAYINFMNVLGDFELTLDQPFPEQPFPEQPFPEQSASEQASLEQAEKAGPVTKKAPVTAAKKAKASEAAVKAEAAPKKAAAARKKSVAAKK